MNNFVKIVSAVALVALSESATSSKISPYENAQLTGAGIRVKTTLMQAERIAMIENGTDKVACGMCKFNRWLYGPRRHWWC